jgi:hypothetical protein
MWTLLRITTSSLRLANEDVRHVLSAICRLREEIHSLLHLKVMFTVYSLETACVGLGLHTIYSLRLYAACWELLT